MKATKYPTPKVLADEPVTRRPKEPGLPEVPQEDLDPNVDHVRRDRNYRTWPDGTQEDRPTSPQLHPGTRVWLDHLQAEPHGATILAPPREVTLGSKGPRWEYLVRLDYGDPMVVYWDQRDLCPWDQIPRWERWWDRGLSWAMGTQPPVRPILLEGLWALESLMTSLQSLMEASNQDVSGKA